MAEQAEQAFVTSFLNNLSTQPVAYSDDYQQPPENSLKRVPVLSVDLPAPPKRKKESSTAFASIQITFKSTKPSKSFVLSVQPTDPISTIKSQLASQSGAPPSDAQRLLLRGKALADGKLLKEYNVQDGDTVNLMVKPGFDWDSKPKPTITTATKSESAPSPTGTKPHPQLSIPKRHGRTPSIVLSPSPSGGSPISDNDKPLDINLTLDTSTIPTASLTTAVQSTYHSTIANPGYWDRLYTFVKAEFSTEGDAITAFEDYLRASKGELTASEIAKIRDQTGVVGMAGT